MDKITGFFAYPAVPTQIAQTIKDALEITNKSGKHDFRKVGIFDTLGYETYATASELAGALSEIEDTTPLRTAATPNRATPIYLLETPVRGASLTHIVSRIKKARLLYRSFNPGE